MSKSRGLMLIHSFRPLPVGGAEPQAENLAQKLAEMGHPMQILTPRKMGDSLEVEFTNNVKIQRVSFPFPYFFDHAQIPLFQYLVQHRKEFDILHAHMAFGHAVVAVTAGHLLNKKTVVKIACAGEFGDLQTILKFKDHERATTILHQADIMIAVSRDVEKELLDFGFSKDQIAYIPNGVDTDRFQRQPFQNKDGIFRFVLMGRKHPQKGIDTALEAVQILKDQNPHSRFVLELYGTDYPEYNYKKMADEFGLSSLVSFMSYTTDVLSVYQQADCFLLPSRGEGLSNALLEAMSMELPVIATPISGTQDVIDENKDGLFVSIGSASELANAMQVVMEEPAKAQSLGRHAREKAIEKFSIQNTARQYSELYEKLRS